MWNSSTGFLAEGTDSLLSLDQRPKGGPATAGNSVRRIGQRAKHGPDPNHPDL